MKFKFDLQSALAGAKVVHDDGRVSRRVKMSQAGGPYPVEVLWDNAIHPAFYTVDGKLWDDPRHVPVLFMLEPTPTLQQELANALEGVSTWLDGALKCKDWVWDPEQRQVATETLQQARDVLKRATLEQNETDSNHD